MKFSKIFLHSGAFKLERGHRISLAEELESSLVIQRNGIYVYVYTSVFLYVCQSLLQYGKRPQPEEVHLEHSYVFYPCSFILGNPSLYPFCNGNRNMLHQVMRTYDHGTGVDSGLADRTLKLLGEICATVARHPGKCLQLCGELAGSWHYTPLLLGAGLRRLSMNPSVLPSIRDRIRSLRLSDCEELYRNACECDDAEQVYRLLTLHGYGKHGTQVLVKGLAELSAKEWKR